MQEIGRVLRDAREARGLSIQDVYNALRITPEYLGAMEDGLFQELPSESHARGYLRKYAKFLKLDDEQLLESYTHIQSTRPIKPAPTPPPEPATAPLNLPNQPEGGTFFNHLNTELVTATDQDTSQDRVGWVIIAALVFFIGLLAWRFLPQFISPEQASAIPGLEAVIQDQIAPDATTTPAVTPIPTPLETTELVIPTGRTNGGAADVDAAGSESDVEIDTQLPPPTPTLNPLPATIDVIDMTIDITERAWVRIVVDDITVFEGQVTSGDTLAYIGTDYVTIRSGNGYALAVRINETDIGRLGERNQVVDITWETAQ